MGKARLGALGLAGALGIGGLFGLSGPAQAATCQFAKNTATCTYTDPAVAETFVGPAGVTTAQITLRGGSGGHGAKPPLNTVAAGGAGGAGGLTAATVELTPGTVLRIYVGGSGGDGQASVASCETGDPGGSGGLSGGIQTGGNGGPGYRPVDDQGCSAGGGGGGSFVMAGGQTLDQVAGGAVPLLVAGGGGGGGGGSEQVGGAGGNGGSASGATAGGPPTQFPGPGPYGGAPGASGSITGGSGPQALPSVGPADDAGGGGGGGYFGGEAGGRTSGGGGGAGLGPDGNGAVPAGASGLVTITYSITDTAQCSADGGKCVAEPPAGEETKFKIVASGGNENATLVATLNGGLPPTCKSVGGDLSPDWVQFGFSDPKDGKTWSKRIRVTGTDPTAKSTAQHTLAETQICFAAPYRFVVKRGTDLKRVGKNWEGLLAHCKSDIVAEAKLNQPDLARPCVLNRSLVQKGDGWVVRANYFVPNGELDPQGRSLRKKKKRHN
jgi:hypothetical protein